MPDLRKFIFKGKKYDIVSKVDTTLTQDNIPGDAKVIGDKLNQLNEKVDTIEVTGSSKVLNADTHFDFPSVGEKDWIYKAYKEKKTYQWNVEELRYEPLNESTIEDVNLINGGNADGTFN